MAFVADPAKLRTIDIDRGLELLTNGGAPTAIANLKSFVRMAPKSVFQRVGSPMRSVSGGTITRPR
jgi:hypothetical protein